jgi:predicted glutamine amidotransferase
MFEIMLASDIVRGKDSTGVASVTDKGVNIVKDTVYPLSLMRTKGYREKIKQTFESSTALIGHNRSSTIGITNKRNAHPFRHGHITLVHNGTLHKSINVKGHGQFGTDSESICASIARCGIEETYSKLDGAAALMWWDEKTGRLNTVRNYQRPLVMCYTEDYQHIFFASQEWLITDIAEQRGINLSMDKKKDKPDVTEATPHDMWSFWIDEETGMIAEDSNRLVPLSHVTNYGKGYTNRANVMHKNNLIGGTTNGASTPTSLYDKGSRVMADRIKDVIEGDKLFTQDGVKLVFRRGIWQKDCSATVNVEKKVVELAGVVPDPLVGKRTEKHSTSDPFQFSQDSEDHEDFFPPAYEENWDVDKTDNVTSINDFHKRNLTPARFEEHYRTCQSCSESLVGEFETALILDENMAFCEACGKVAELAGMPMTSMALRGA